MNVLVTGSKGFIGKNLLVYLREKKDVRIYEYDIENNFDDIVKNIDDIDFIYHFAGVNRPKDVKEFYEGNSDLTVSIVDLLNSRNKNIPLVYASSIQADLDNDYGKSKKKAEDYIRNNYSNGIIYRFHNVFGKWCKPNYNSVIATFCYNISHDLEINITDREKEIELVYIDDICETLVTLLDNCVDVSKDINYVFPRYKKTLGELADTLYVFKECMNSIYVPKTGDPFIKKLFATYVSYVELHNMVTDIKTNVDNRGSFSELVRTNDSGQFSVSFSKPGIVRGNHYHNTKMERFIVIKGKAKISFKKVNSDEHIEFTVSEDKLQVVTIPVGYTHNIENIGDNEMILFIWCNELFDQSHPDTYFMEV